MKTIPAKILAAYLKRASTVDHDRLFVWLGLAAKQASHDAGATIRAWLSQHPSSYKAVVRFAADRLANSSDLHLEVDRRLFAATEPLDFDAWCLREAAKKGTYDPDLLASYRKRQQQKAQNIAEFTSRSAERKRQREAEARQRRTEWRRLINDQQPALRENRATPAILHQLAATYLGWFVDVEGTDGHSRLRNLLGDDALVDTVVNALRASTTRADLPDMAAIFRLGDEGRQHSLMLPVLVGLIESSSLRPGKAPLDEQGMRRALAFRFNAPDFWNQTPKWFHAVYRLTPSW